MPAQGSKFSKSERLYETVLFYCTIMVSGGAGDTRRGRKFAKEQIIEIPHPDHDTLQLMDDTEWADFVQLIGMLKLLKH